MSEKTCSGPKRLNNRAFTLLEVVIAMLLLGIALLGLMGLQIRSVRSNAFSNYMTVASCFARNQVENLRADSSSDWGSIADGSFSDTITDKGMVFSRQWVIQTDSADRIRDVSVTVSWDQDDQHHDVDMSTRITKRE